MVRSTKIVSAEVTRSLSTGFPPASSPGDPPHHRSGDLRRSVFDRVTESRPGRFEGTVGVRAEHGIHLEFGTRRMAARPFLRPALDEFRPRYQGVMRTAIEASLRGVK